MSNCVGRYFKEHVLEVDKIVTRKEGLNYEPLKIILQLKGLNDFYPPAVWCTFGSPPSKKKTCRFPLVI